jgi:diguanylate cyclase (GGDEF)-like protein/PAS domain S-box-containing protein
MKAAFEPADVAVQEEEVPVDEADRLVSLHRLGLLHTAPSAAFDGVTRVAAAALRVPLLLVTLVDQNRLWFKSRVGLTLRQTPRRGSLCSQVVLQRQSLTVRDASADARFAAHALVSGPTRIRAYLGIPLYTRDRQPVGTLCAMDTEVRDFGEVELVVLSEFAKIAEELLASQEVASKSDGVLQYALERQRLFRETFEQAAVGILHTSLHGAILRTNPRACALLGYSAAELRELSFRHLTHPDDFPRNVGEFKRALAGEIDSYRVEQRLRCKDQTYLWAAVSVSLRRMGPRQADYSIVFVDDISAQKQSEIDAVRARDAAQDRMEQQTLKLNKESAEALDFLQRESQRALSTEGSLKETQSSLTDTRQALAESRQALAENQQALAESQEAVLSTQEALLSTQAALHSTQETLLSTQQALLSTQQALLEAQAAQREAQSSLQTTQAKLAAESATDALTALPNRRTFSRRCEQAAQALRNLKKPYGLILLDVDGLKLINDEHGHDVGDEVLRTLGQMLSSQMRNSSDMAARLDGDEFGILCFGDVNEQTLHDVAERLHSQIGKGPLAMPKGLLRFAGSFGLALSMPDDPDWKTLFGRADAALREAKAAGKDRISFGRSPSKSSTQRMRALSAPSASG